MEKNEFAVRRATSGGAVFFPRSLAGEASDVESLRAREKSEKSRCRQIFSLFFFLLFIRFRFSRFHSSSSQHEVKAPSLSRFLSHDVPQQARRVHRRGTDGRGPRPRLRRPRRRHRLGHHRDRPCRGSQRGVQVVRGQRDRVERGGKIALVAASDTKKENKRGNERECERGKRKKH